MFQLPHNRLDDVLIHAVVERDFRICRFDRASVMKLRLLMKWMDMILCFRNVSVTGTIVNFCCGIRKAPPLY